MSLRRLSHRALISAWASDVWSSVGALAQAPIDKQKKEARARAGASKKILCNVIDKRTHPRAQ
jgi:hypothetical protein